MKIKNIIFLIFLYLNSVLANSTQDHLIVRDRLRFMALEQSKKISGYWDPSQRDCSGFVRFLYRQSALGANGKWLNRNGEKVDYLKADELIGYNFTPITRDTTGELLQTGDLLVWYFDDKAPSDSWHIMIYLGPFSSKENRSLLIYHNGDRNLNGAVKKVWLQELLSYKAGPWRPALDNHFFKGVFRWNGFMERI